MTEKRAIALILIGGGAYITAVMLGLSALGASDEAIILAAMLAVIVMPVLASAATLRYGPDGTKHRD